MHPREEVLKALPCMHTFHEYCLDRWHQTAGTQVCTNRSRGSMRCITLQLSPTCVLRFAVERWGGSRDTSVQLRVPCFFRVASFLKVFVQHLVALHGCPVPDSSRRGKPANTCTNGCHHSPLMIDDATNDMINFDDDEASATENGADFFEAAAQAAMNAADVIAG